MRRLTLSGIALALFIPTLAQAASAPAASGDARLRIDAAIERAITEKRIVGAVVLVSRDGKLVYQRAVGLADREAKRPMQLDTVFRLASVSKPIVSAAALALVDQGKLSLDDPVTKWLPDFRPKVASGAALPITVRQLLTHTSGLGYKFAEKPGTAYYQAGVSDGFDELRIGLDENRRGAGDEAARSARHCVLGQGARAPRRAVLRREARARTDGRSALGDVR